MLVLFALLLRGGAVLYAKNHTHMIHREHIIVVSRHYSPLCWLLYIIRVLSRRFCVWLRHRITI